MSGEVNGNRKTSGSYSFQKCHRHSWAIYKKDTEYSSVKIAEITQSGDEGYEIAKNMVAALNSREKYLSKINHNLIENGYQTTQ